MWKSFLLFSPSVPIVLNLQLLCVRVGLRMCVCVFMFFLNAIRFVLFLNALQLPSFLPSFLPSLCINPVPNPFDQSIILM